MSNKCPKGLAEEIKDCINRYKASLDRTKDTITKIRLENLQLAANIAVEIAVMTQMIKAIERLLMEYGVETEEDKN